MNLFLLVLVESLARFHTQLPLGHKLVQHWAGVEEGVLWIILVPAVNDELHRVESDVVCELEGAHRVPGAQLHPDVDVPVTLL